MFPFQREIQEVPNLEIPDIRILLKNRNSISNEFFHIDEWTSLQISLKNFHNLLQHGLKNKKHSKKHLSLVG